jgi:hypothetical protein
MTTSSIAAAASVHTSCGLSASTPPIAHVANLTPGWFENGSLSFELAKGLPTTIIAMIVVYIAWRQYRVAEEQKRVARAKLNLEIFERRLNIFQVTEQFLLHTLDGTSHNGNEFTALFAEASFLFESEIEAYMRLSMANCVAFMTLKSRHTGQNQIVRPENDARENELIEWLTSEYGGGCRLKFAPYLDFSEWR